MILFLSNADTELLALRSVIEGLPDDFPRIRAGNPNLLDDAPSLDGFEVVILRLLGGRSAWEAPFDALRAACLEADIPLLAFGGEAVPDAELATLSTVPSATLTDAFAYLVNGGMVNISQLLRFVADTVMMGGFGFETPVEIPAVGVWDGWQAPAEGDSAERPKIAIVFYRAHVISGNTQFVADLCDAVWNTGGSPLPVWCYSLRPDDDGRVAALDLVAERNASAMITTVLAAGGSGQAGKTTHEDDHDEWVVPQLAELDIAVVQGMTSYGSRAAWEESEAGLSPLDVAMGVAIPEFDGRIVSVPFSFKEVVDDGDELGVAISAYRTDPERTARVAGIAMRHALLRHTEPEDKKVALVLSAYPTKKSRLGNAVALDTPASVIDLLWAMRRAGYRVDRIPTDGDELMAELADTLTYDLDTFNDQQLTQTVGRFESATYRSWFETLPDDAQEVMVESWGAAPGTAYVHDDALHFAGMDLGGVIIAIQPPRAFTGNPVAAYHSPDLPPTHHYLGFYRWLDTVWGADAVVHCGKHGTLEWTPGKGVGLSASCFPDAALGDLPFFYPFVVNDPGEGTQAKRRTHATIVDHLLPPMTRAETYDELARLEALLDEYGNIEALDPAKLPAIQAKVWDCLVEIEIARDMGIETVPDEDDFGDVIGEIDYYLCELKDAQIRGGLHTLGRVPEGEAELDLALSITRLRQGSVPSLREALADELGVGLESLGDVDAVEAEGRARLAGMQESDWAYDGADPTLRWVSSQLIPNLRRAVDEVGNLLHGLDGGYIASGPSGAPTRGSAHVLPTGRNFYTVDPKAVPSPLAYEVGTALADALLARHLEEEGGYPETVGLVIWGTAAMRTQGDDVAEALALLGVRPVWNEMSGRVTGLEVIPIAELGRPRIDVTLRISGFFRDAFPGQVSLLDEAVALVAELDEADADNMVRAHGADDPRIFGPKPGGYGSGILPLLESRDWRSDEDLAAVYQVWGGYSYGRGGMGVAAPEAMQRRFSAIDVAVKNQDNREHDIFDSDDYLQDHGGMIATVRALTGRNPKAWFGDSSNPANPKVRSLAEEAARVVRTRVVNPKWINAMQNHGYKGAFEMAATVDYLFGYDATAQVVEDWMYERVTERYVADEQVRKFFADSNPWALRSIAEKLLEANERGMWSASEEALTTLRAAVLEAEANEESRT